MLQRFKKWFTIDHVVDLMVDMALLLFDVISSPVLIVVRVVRYFIGEYIIEHIKSAIKWLVHFYVERCNKFWRIVLAVLFLVVAPIALLIFFGIIEVLQVLFTVFEEEIY